MDNSDIVNNFRPHLDQFEKIYREIHKDAELSGLETNTARRAANHLSSLGFEVTKHVGNTGVVGVLRNGKGRCVMLRAEMDALPIEECTGLPYACNKKMQDVLGREQPVMHAAGHDLHMACLLAAVTLLRQAVSQWQGTLIVVFQPSKVNFEGGKSMVDQGLYDIAPVPDAIFGQSTGPFAAGHINIRGGPVLMSEDIVSIRLYSSLGYRANPQVSLNPARQVAVLISLLNAAARAIGGETHVLFDVNEIHAGDPAQDWMSHLDLVLSVKAYDENLRRRFLEQIEMMALSVSRGNGIQEAPKVEVTARAPLTSNHSGLAETLRSSFGEHFGAGVMDERYTDYPCEDFPRLAEPHDIPYVFWFLGRQEPHGFTAAIQADTLLDDVPHNNSPFNAPEFVPTLQTGTDTLALAALSLLSWSSSQTSESEETSETDEAYESEVTTYSP